MCGGADSEDFLLPTYDMMMAVRIYTPQNSTVFCFECFLEKVLQRKHSLVTPCAYIPLYSPISHYHRFPVSNSTFSTATRRSTSSFGAEATAIT
jgi:hypothetical protein